MKRLTVFMVLLMALTCNQNKNQYEAIISKTDSCVIKDRYQVEIGDMTGDTLENYKEVLTRAVKPESPRNIRNDFFIEFYNRQHQLGTLTIQLDSANSFANFNSEQLKFGFRISYGLGMSLDELQRGHNRSN